MAIQILPREQGLGELLGTGLGSGLSSGLQQLAQQKLQQLQSRQQQAALVPGIQSALGVSPQKAQQLAGMPTSLLQEIFKTQGRVGKEAGLHQALGQLGLGVGGEQQAPFSQEGLAQPQQGLQQQVQQEGGILGRPQLSEKGATEIAKIQQEQAKEARKDVKQKWEYSKDFIGAHTKLTTQARKNEVRYNNMEQLADTGKLTNPLLYSLMKKTGLDFKSLLTPEAEGYQKNVQEFITGMKDVFGARITEKMIEEYLKMLPTLENSQAGKKLIINMQRLKGTALMAENKAIKDIIAENGGVPPYDLQLKLQDKIGNIYDDLAAQMKELIGNASNISQGGSQARVGESYSNLGQAKDFSKGATAINEETGVEYVFDGKKWKKA